MDYWSCWCSDSEQDSSSTLSLILCPLCPSSSTLSPRPPVPPSCSKRSLGSHEYVQNCRKWENEISLQLLSQSTMRRDLARTVSPPRQLPRPPADGVSPCSSSQAEDDHAPVDLEKHLDQVDRPFRENVTR